MPQSCSTAAKCAVADKMNVLIRARPHNQTEMNCLINEFKLKKPSFIYNAVLIKNKA